MAPDATEGLGAAAPEASPIAPAGPPIKVRATTQGVYGHYRNPGDVFYIDKDEDFSEGWMERLDGAPSGQAMVTEAPVPSAAFVFTDEDEVVRHYTVDEMAADPAKRDQMAALMQKVQPDMAEATIQHLDDTIADFKKASAPPAPIKVRVMIAGDYYGVQRGEGDEFQIEGVNADEIDDPGLQVVSA